MSEPWSNRKLDAWSCAVIAIPLLLVAIKVLT